jgi:hypothetical protein
MELLTVQSNCEFSCVRYLLRKSPFSLLLNGSASPMEKKYSILYSCNKALLLRPLLAGRAGLCPREWANCHFSLCGRPAYVLENHQHEAIQLKIIQQLINKLQLRN